MSGRESKSDAPNYRDRRRGRRADHEPGDVGVPRREHFSTQVSAATQARVRATVRGMAQHSPNGFTLAQFVDDALDAYCKHLEELHHQDKPWPTTATRLRPGPRV